MAHALASARVLRLCARPVVPKRAQTRRFAVRADMEPIPGYATTKQTITAGSGPVVAKGDTVTVHATGIVEEGDKKFWSTKDPGQKPFTYQAGVGAVITGWDQGCLGMNVGETRKLKIPAKEGYGAGGFPAWGIPPGGTLLFEIEVLSIKGKGGEL
uniref:peptidylprolyl isomerase n=1 Tax=Micromonas pusilla TaxID=38833 RepID=A0A7S0KA87_MICPS